MALFAQQASAYSYGVDSSFNEPRYIKLFFNRDRSCADSRQILVPANAKHMPLFSHAKSDCKLSAVELFDKNLRLLSKQDYAPALEGNKIFIIDSNGKLS